MNIILYGIPADTAELIAGRYDLELIHSIEEIGACGALLPVPKITAPRQLLALYIIGKTRCDEVQNQMRLLEG